MDQSARPPFWRRLASSLAATFLRTAAVLSRAAGKITETCPACRWSGLPLCRCPGCGTLHEELLPSVNGVTSLSCSCGALLATTDSGGRRDYARVCRNPACRRAWPKEGPAQLAAYHLAVVGRDRSFLFGALQRLLEDYATANDVKLSFLDPQEEEAFRSGLQAVATGGEPPTWAGCTIVVRPVGSRPRLLYFYDLTGKRPGEYALPEILDGLVYLSDAPGQPPAEELPASAQRGRRFDVPVALVVRAAEKPEADASGSPWPKLHDLAGHYASFTVAAREAERDSAALRLYLIKAGLGDLANALEIRFERVAYFAAQFGSFRTLAPLIWLGHQAGAMSDAGEPSQALWNLRRFCRRALSGREGRHAANAVLALIFFGGPLVLILLGLVLGWKLLGVLICAGIAAWIWVRHRGA